MKTTIYLLPGLMCNEKLWSRLLPLFDESYELIALDLPLKKCFDEMVEELEVILPQEPVYLLGFSLGGYLASYFAVKHPHRVSKLFIVGNSAAPIGDDEIKRRKQAIELTQNFGFKTLSQKKVQSLLEERNQNDETLIDLIQEMYVDLGEEVYYVQMESTLYRNDLLEALCALTMPIHFFYSQKDRLIDIHWLNSFIKKAPQVCVISNESSSHMLPLEKPQELCVAIKEWIKS